MKTSNGKYIAPQSIEIPLQSNPYIAQAMVIAEGKPYVSAVIVPNFETLMEKYEEFKNYLSLNIEEKKKLLETPFIKETFEKVVNDIQKEFASFEKIKKFKLLPEEFTIERGEITPTLKIKRKIILEKFKANDEGEDVEVTDPGGRPGNRLAGFLGVRHGEEAHQDVRQTSGTEHQRHTDGDGGDRILDQGTRTHDGVFLGVHFNRLGEQRFRREAELQQNGHRHEGGTAEEHDGLDDLHPGRCGHAAEQHVHQHDDADEDFGVHVFETEEHLDQLTGTDHLRNHVEGDDDQGS
jgi:hypothetical protein